jgi:alpha-1,2-glucosyltransferase
MVSYSGFQVLLNFIQVCLRNLLTILCLVWPFVGIILGFIIFLILNGGSIVVGDKSNHEAGFHGSQLLYFIFVAATGFGLSHASRKQIHSFATSLRQKTKSFGGIFFIMGIFCLVVFCIDRFSPVHRFMLADNRHYTFYIWRKFFLKHPKAKFLPISLYLYFGWRCYIELSKVLPLLN